MTTICDIPDCPGEVKGRVTIFAEGFDGGLYVGLCMAHLFGLVNAWPLVAAGLAGKET